MSPTRVMDINSIFSEIANFFLVRNKGTGGTHNNNKHGVSTTCDGFILRMHYRWTFYLLMTTFLTVWFSWYYREVISCVIDFDSSKRVDRLDYINICLSYPYITDVGGNKRYILFYRWISWSFLLLAGLYYMPRKVAKTLENELPSYHHRLFEDIAVEKITPVEMVEKTINYITVTLGTNNNLYIEYFVANFVALVVDIITFFYLNFILQGRFIVYGYTAYPFNRDPEKFNDYISQTFPPFVLCTLSPGQNQLTTGREELIICHLTLMELYEKVFLILWVWLIVLIFCTCCYIIFLCTVCFPYVRMYLLWMTKPSHATDRTWFIVKKVVARCNIGDVYLLYCLKGYISRVYFYDILVKLSKISNRPNHNQPVKV